MSFFVKSSKLFSETTINEIRKIFSILEQRQLPDEKTVERVANGIFENEKKFGKKYCPCRRVTGDAKNDEKIICPCIYHKDEIAKDGRCFCGLFTK